MNDKKIKFRSAMGGYNKEDVNNYIESLSAKYYEAEADSRKKIAELEKKIKELEESVPENQAELEELREKAEKADGIIVEMNGVIDRLKEEKESLVNENAKLTSRIAECEKMTEASSEIYEKSTKYDKVSEQIGSMIVSANAKAESIVSDAEIRARVTAKRMIDTTLEKLEELNEKYADQILSKTVQFTDELNSLAKTASNFCMTTKSSVQEDCIKIKESLEVTKRVILEDNYE